MDDICDLVQEYISIQSFSASQYISTENLIPNRGGVQPSLEYPTTAIGLRYKPGDILISNIRPYLKKIWLASHNGACSTDIIVLRSRGEVSSQLLYHLLSRDNFFTYVMNNAVGTKMPRGDKQIIRLYPVAFPCDKRQQEIIIKILSSVDKKILLTRKTLEKYESIKKATVNLLLKPKEGWQEIQIGNVCQEVHERVSCSELTINTYISTENLVPERQGIVPASSVPIGINAIRFQRNDILVSNIRPYLKKIWYADFWGGCSNDVIVYRANEKVNPRFLFHLLSQDAFFNFAMDNATGTKMPRGDRKLLQLFAISIPSSLSEQEQISISIDKLSLILDNIYKSIKKLEKHKHSLLQYFFN